jgi:hypothetical protein
MKSASLASMALGLAVWFAGCGDGTDMMTETGSWTFEDGSLHGAEVRSDSPANTIQSLRVEMGPPDNSGSRSLAVHANVMVTPLAGTDSTSFVLHLPLNAPTNLTGKKVSARVHYLPGGVAPVVAVSIEPKVVFWPVFSSSSWATYEADFHSPAPRYPGVTPVTPPDVSNVSELKLVFQVQSLKGPAAVDFWVDDVLIVN